MSTLREKLAARTVLFRYLLFQVPSWVAAAAILALIQLWGWVEPPWPLILFAGLVAKDIVLYPWLRIAHEPSTLHGPQALLDAIAVVERPLAPEGSVRIGPELWRARCVRDSRLSGRGHQVRVIDVDGLTLLVEPAEPRDTARSAASA